MLEFMNEFYDVVMNTVIPFFGSVFALLFFLIFAVIILLYVSLFLCKGLREFFYENIFQFEECERLQYLSEDNAHFRHMLYDCGKQSEVIDYDNVMHLQRKGKK